MALLFVLPKSLSVMAETVLQIRLSSWCETLFRGEEKKTPFLKNCVEGNCTKKFSRCLICFAKLKLGWKNHGILKMQQGELKTCKFQKQIIAIKLSKGMPDSWEENLGEFGKAGHSKASLYMGRI